MNEPAADATALMVLKLWMESGERMRVRVMSTNDVRSGISTTSYASTRREVLELVGDWLDSCMKPG